jgi:hypothetical protein
MTTTKLGKRLAWETRDVSGGVADAGLTAL